MQQTLFNFDETFRRKLKAASRRRGISMKSFIEEAVWPLVKDEDVFEEELAALVKPGEVSAELMSIGKRIPEEERRRRMQEDERFADIMSI